jgi:hypothetical protein
MPDPRFFDDQGPASLSELARLGGAQLSDPALADRLIATVAPLDAADGHAIAFFSDAKRKTAAASTQAGACFVRSEHRDLLAPGCAALLTPHPQASWAAAATRLYAPRRHDPLTPAIHPDCELEHRPRGSPSGATATSAPMSRGRLRPDRRPGEDPGRRGDRRARLRGHGGAQGADRHPPARPGDRPGRGHDRRQQLHRPGRVRRHRDRREHQDRQSGADRPQRPRGRNCVMAALTPASRAASPIGDGAQFGGGPASQTM